MVIIKHSGQHLLQLINDILDISKIEAQKLEVEQLDVDVVSLMKEINDHCSILCQGKQIYFEIEYQFPVPALIRSDPTGLKQILINLCSNAIQFTEKGGIIINVSCDQLKEKIHFSVRDTGIGLTEAQIKKLFTPYEQAEKATARQFGGTGLGLYLAKQFAEKLGGDISVRSEFQKGSTFILAISTGPLAERVFINQLQDNEAFSAGAKTVITSINVAETKTVTLPNSNQKTRRLTAVLAEDNPVNQKLFTKMLQHLELNVLNAADGLEAVALVLNNKVDVVFMDMNMPIMDGTKATEYLRNKGFATPIFALTADESAEAIELCKQAGCNQHVTKPINEKQLAELVEGLAEGKDYKMDKKA